MTCTQTRPAGRRLGGVWRGLPRSGSRQQNFLAAGRRSSALERDEGREAVAPANPKFSSALHISQSSFTPSTQRSADVRSLRSFASAHRIHAGCRRPGPRGARCSTGPLPAAKGARRSRGFAPRRCRARSALATQHLEYEAAYDEVLATHGIASAAVSPGGPREGRRAARAGAGAAEAALATPPSGRRRLPVDGGGVGRLGRFLLHDGARRDRPEAVHVARSRPPHSIATMASRRSTSIPPSEDATRASRVRASPRASRCSRAW